MKQGPPGSLVGNGRGNGRLKYCASINIEDSRHQTSEDSRYQYRHINSLQILYTKIGQTKWASYASTKHAREFQLSSHRRKKGYPNEKTLCRVVMFCRADRRRHYLLVANWRRIHPQRGGWRGFRCRDSDADTTDQCSPACRRLLISNTPTFRPHTPACGRSTYRRRQLFLPDLLPSSSR